MLPRPLRVIYLHGFASGPKSRKATFFAAHLLEQGIRMEIPDLAEANFEDLTISAQLRLMERLIAGEPVVLIGSSMGGYLAALLASTNQNIQKLLLLAPAFGFLDLWRVRLGAAEMERWRMTNRLSVYHYGDKQEHNLHYGLMTDAALYSGMPKFWQPALIFHGEGDDTVPIGNSIEFASRHPNVCLMRLQSDHELGDVLDPIWQESVRFLLDASVQNE